MGYGEDTLVVNRSIKPLDFTWDGKHYVLKPGYKLDGAKVIGAGLNGRPSITHMPYQMAEMARRQNVLMGTEDPMAPRDVQHLVGIAVEDENGNLVAAPGWINNTITHAEQTSATERLNRKQLDPEAQTAQPRRAGSWPRSRASAEPIEPFKAGNESLVGIDTRG